MLCARTYRERTEPGVDVPMSYRETEGDDIPTVRCYVLRVSLCAVSDLTSQDKILHKIHKTERYQTKPSREIVKIEMRREFGLASKERWQSSE